MKRKLLVVSMGCVIAGCGIGTDSKKEETAASMLAGVMPTPTSTSANKVISISSYPAAVDTPQLVVRNSANHTVEFWTTIDADGSTVPVQSLYSGKTGAVRIFYSADGLPQRIQNESTGEFLLAAFTDVTAMFQTFDKDGRFIGGYQISEKDGKYYVADIIGRSFFSGQMTLDLTGGTNPASAVLLPDSEIVLGEAKELPANLQKFATNYATAGAKSAISLNAGKSLAKGALFSTWGGIIYVSGATTLIGAAAPLIGTALIAVGVWNVAQGLKDINGTSLNYIQDTFRRFESGESPSDILRAESDDIAKDGELSSVNFVDRAKRVVGDVRDLLSRKVDQATLLAAQALDVVKTNVSGVSVDTQGVVVQLKGVISEAGILLANGQSKDGSKNLTVNATVNGSNQATGAFTGYMRGSVNGQQQPLGACSAQQSSGGQGSFVKAHNMNASSGVSAFYYQAYDIPDQFTVSTFDGAVFGTPGLVSGSSTVQLNIPRNGIFVVSVNAPRSNTAWNYNLSCPF